MTITDDPLNHISARRSSYLAQLVAGYGLYKTLIDQTYSTAMSTVENSYGVVNSVDFALVASFAILLCSALVVVVGWQRPRAALRPAAIACMALLVAVNFASGVGLFAETPLRLLGVAFALVYGAAAIVANASWLVEIAALDARACLATLGVAFAMSSLLSEAAGFLPDGVRPFALITIGLVSVAMFTLTGRTRPPRPTGARSPRVLPCVRGVLAELAGPLVIFIALNTVLGLITSFQVSGAQALAGSSLLKAAASTGANLVIVAVAVCAKGTPSIRAVFGRMFPVVALLLMALPFMDHVYGALFSALLTFLQVLVSTMVLFMLLETSKRRGIPVIAAVGGISFASRLFVLGGLALGSALGSQQAFDATTRTLIVVVVTIYLLSLALVWLLRSRSGEPGSKGTVTDSVMLDDTHKTAGAGDTRTETTTSTKKGSAEELAVGPDPLAAHAEELACACCLTAREADVALLLARGRSATYIAEKLGIAASTVRGYAKSAYVKLGVHSKQELIDLYTRAR